ncbi:MAD2L1-binding protein [Stylosanthes scabra]|uniref:MAD2L1-binding protein n=1 Tax=Stylosanthes scabra TaxID=79078 RepID=A0ABU6ZDN2_9FABA|nr:MAD2L1-binding protein [Stylosanthes scabra]
MTGSKLNGTAEESLLYDHRPHILFEDDYLRVCQIPKRKGANFRDLPGVVVIDNVVRRHPTESPSLLPSGKPLANLQLSSILLDLDSRGTIYRPSMLDWLLCGP